MSRRKGAPPVETSRPGPRRTKVPPMAHFNTRVHAPRSLLQSLETLQRCIWSEDGAMTNNRQWLEIDRKQTKIRSGVDVIEGEYANAVLVTADGRRWLVEVKEVKL